MNDQPNTSRCALSACSVCGWWMRLNGYALLIGTGMALMSGEQWWACAVSAFLAHHFVKRGEEMRTQNTEPRNAHNENGKYL